MAEEVSMVEHEIRVLEDWYAEHAGAIPREVAATVDARLRELHLILARLQGAA